LVFVGPRAGILVWWILQPNRWDAAFDNFIWAFLGFIFAPWTTLMYVTVAPSGVTGFDWVIIGIGVLADVASYSAAGYESRERYMVEG
jgi:hypothetical protein